MSGSTAGVPNFTNELGSNPAHVIIGIFERSDERPDSERIAQLPQCIGGFPAHIFIPIFECSDQRVNGARVAQLSQRRGSSHAHRASLHT